MPRHHGLPGGRSRRRRVLGQRHPARHPRSEESRPPRSGHGQELRLLALGDDQQRRTKVIFTDEWGGGTRPRCRAADPLTWGADAIFDVVEVNGAKKLKFGGYFKMPAP